MVTDGPTVAIVTRWNGWDLTLAFTNAVTSCNAALLKLADAFPATLPELERWIAPRRAPWHLAHHSSLRPSLPLCPNHPEHTAPYGHKRYHRRHAVTAV